MDPEKNLQVWFVAGPDAEPVITTPGQSELVQKALHYDRGSEFAALGEHRTRSFCTVLPIVRGKPEDQVLSWATKNLGTEFKLYGWLIVTAETEDGNFVDVTLQDTPKIIELFHELERKKIEFARSVTATQRRFEVIHMEC